MRGRESLRKHIPLQLVDFAGSLTNLCPYKDETATTAAAANDDGDNDGRKCKSSAQRSENVFTTMTLNTLCYCKFYFCVSNSWYRTSKHFRHLLHEQSGSWKIDLFIPSPQCKLLALWLQLLHSFRSWSNISVKVIYGSQYVMSV